MDSVRASPTSNIMPQAMAALRYGIAGGFSMDAAKPDAQLKHGRQVPWTDAFIEDIKQSLLTCRVLYVFTLSGFPNFFFLQLISY